MIKDGVWNVPMQRAAEYFREHAEVTEESENVFLFRSCRITLKEQKPSRMGIWSSKRIHMRIEGEDTDVEAIHRLFFIRFLSLG